MFFFAVVFAKSTLYMFCEMYTSTTELYTEFIYVQWGLKQLSTNIFLLTSWDPESYYEDNFLQKKNAFQEKGRVSGG